MSTLIVDEIKDTSGGSKVKIGGHVVQVIQFTAAEQSISSETTIINSTFTPKLSGSKFAVFADVPNCTATAGGSVTMQCYLGTSGTPSSNTLIIQSHERMEGTGADDTKGINGHDFGTFTASGVGLLYASMVLTPDHATTVARHSNVVKLMLQEIAQ